MGDADILEVKFALDNLTKRLEYQDDLFNLNKYFLNYFFLIFFNYLNNYKGFNLNTL